MPFFASTCAVRAHLAGHVLYLGRVCQERLGGLVVELVGHLDDVVPRWLTHGHGYVRDGVTAFVTGRHLPYL